MFKHGLKNMETYGTLQCEVKYTRFAEAFSPKGNTTLS